MKTTKNVLSKAEKLLCAFSLHEAGIQMKRLQLQRQNPDLSLDEIEQLLKEWLQAPEQETSKWMKERCY